MKNLLIFAFLVAAVSAQAATIKWGTSTKTSYNGSVVGGVSATLIYLGSSDVAASYDFTNSDNLDSIIAKIGTKADESASTSSGMAKGKLSGVWTIGDNGTPNLSNGDKLVVLTTYTDGDKTYYNLSNASASSWDGVAGLWNDWSTSASWAYAGGSAAAAETGKLVAGGGWTTADIPEPATGALALAGIALLFKRRRA